MLSNEPLIQPNIRLHLAPMEGLVDWVLRDTLTSVGGIDQCSTEFIRVTDRLLPDHVFFKYCPELHTQSRTRAGTPVLIQLLGGHPDPLAENAVRAEALGAFGVDFNFGCPAKTVNRHDGGATLLKYPERIYKILAATRAALAAATPLSAKIRLGFDDPSVCIEVAQAVESAGVKTLAIHCRTKTDMYKPPAYWEWIPKIKEKVHIKIIANGEIDSWASFSDCLQQTQCSEFMIGRGAIANPFLFRQIKRELLKHNNFSSETNPRPVLQQMVPNFYNACAVFKNENYAVARTKQWLSRLSAKDENIKEIFQSIKIIDDGGLFKEKLNELFVTVQSASPLQSHDPAVI